MSDLVSDFDFDLPPELIASRPLAERDASRMLVVDRARGTIRHHSVKELPSFLAPGDLAVLNNSKVIKARLKLDEIRGEVLLLETRDANPLRWQALVKPGRRFREGHRVALGGTEATVMAILEDGSRVLEFATAPNLEQYGEMPLPPYMRREADRADDTRYQTVYAAPEGSVAAPTAGLHFTPELLAQVPHTFVTLHVGIGTFLPVKVEKISEHRMHEERYSLSAETAQAINAAKRVLAVGTTSARVLESQPEGLLQERTGRTDIFIHPPYKFRHVDRLLTNFHLPKSTLVMLVSAMAGKQLLREAYEEAIREKYRFFSYGDCMLIL